MTIYDKVKWVLGILMVFVLIIATNLIDRDNFLRVKDSFSSIYEDRLFAKDLIFEMSRLIQEKEMAVALSDTVFFSLRNEQVNSELEDLLAKFEETAFTKEETYMFTDLKNNLAAIYNIEQNIVSSKFSQGASLLQQISNIKQNLYGLSKIQMSEGSKQMSIGQSAIDMVVLFTNFEIYFLIFLAILIQIIVIYKPKQT